VLGWARTSHARFVALAADPASGVRVRDVVEVVADASRPWWADAVPSLRPASPAELPEGAVHGWCFHAPVIDTRTYLPYLRAWFERLGGTIEVRRCDDLRELATPVVVNCTGLGARELCGDAALVPIRGQLVYVENPGIETVKLDEADPGTITYVVPRGDDCVLGGTTLPGDESTEHDPVAAQSILDRTAVLEPRLRGARIIAHAVGLRPGRITVRLEAEAQGDGRVVVHDYGHGGAGVTLSWGCAEEVCELVDGLLG
jgi:D-amino-acid oxidase